MRVLVHTLCVLTLIISQIHAQERRTFKANEQISADKLATNKTALSLDINDDLTLCTTKDDALGYRHYRYQQTYKDIPIEGAIYLMHEKNNRVKHANGQLIRRLNLSTTPTINQATALQAALAHINATRYAWNDPAHEQSIKYIKKNSNASFYPSGELIIIDPTFKQKTANYRLAYKFNIYAIQPHTRQIVYVDAINGNILKTLEKIHNCTDTPASGVAHYSDTVNFTACQEGNTYTLKNNIGGGMQVFDATQSQDAAITDPDGFFESDSAAVAVYWATQKTYEYFRDVHERESLDGDSMPLMSWVHAIFPGGSPNNASWNGAWMSYGDGDGVRYNSLTSPDVVAHEMTHGITDFSANLIYLDESGALNESFSDIFGEVAEWYMRGSNDWLIGGDFVVPTTGKTCIRNMRNPKDSNALTQQPNTYLGEYWHTDAEDCGGVHFNSGVQNRWFYLLSEGGSGTNDTTINGDAYQYGVVGIGIEKAAAIAYRTLTTYLTQTAQYEDARAESIQATIDLYGADSNEEQQVIEAWNAVGVYESSELNPRQSDSLALVALYNSTNGPDWTNTWNLDEPINTWYGVILNENDRVVCLDLDGDTNCTYISNTGNNLVGNIPIEIENLNNLVRLYLGNNQLNGSIPNEIENLNSLTHLDLDNNQLSGIIPPEMGNLNLIWLDLDYNQLSGTIPSEFGNLSNLVYLDLNDNQLSGCYDTNLSVLCTQLNFHQFDGNEDISDGNNFDAPWEDFCATGVGTCPIFTCRELDSLALVELYNSTNGANWTNKWTLTQPIDTWHGLAFDGNGCVRTLNLAGNNLEGPIPVELGDMTGLTRIYLQNNLLNGTIPAEIGNLINLTDLRLYNNQLIGSIPPQIGNLINLDRLFLGTNGLSGEIPPEFSNLTNLIAINLQYNELTGNFPPEISNLINLKEIWAQQNQFSGNLPPQMWSLTKLEKIYLWGNQYTGSISPNVGNLMALRELVIGNQDLTGEIPPELGDLPDLSTLNLGGTNLSGCYHPNLTNLCSQLNSLQYINLPNGRFEDFCLDGTNTCNYDDVLPGDFNANRHASIDDVLHWGIAAGNTGVTRPDSSLDWILQPCPDWDVFVSGINGKHQDGNGDGIVDSQDLDALIQNYDTTYNTDASMFPMLLTPVNYELRNDTVIITADSTIHFYELYVLNADSVHGVACSIVFDDMKVEGVQIDTVGSSLAPDAYVDIFVDQENRLDVAFTRTDGIDQPLDSVPVAGIIVVTHDTQVTDPYCVTLCGQVMSADGSTAYIGNTTSIVYVPECLPSQVISNDAIPVGDSVIYRAKDMIKLDTGFSIHSNAWLDAEIDNCDNQ